MSKRIFDFVFASLGLVFLSPLFILIGFLIKVTSPGPVFFLQKRVGRNFQPFFIYKFRTMVTEAPSTGPSITVQNDPRITPVGKILRDLKIDELPQLINVVKGEMSLIGPRPEVPLYVGQFKKEYEFVLQVRPGMTDLASLEFRNESELLARADHPEEIYLKSILPKKLKLAQAYVREQGFMLDFKILFSTLMAIFLSLPFPFSRGDHRKRKPLKEVIIMNRKGIIFVIQVGVIAGSNYAAFLLRFDGNLPAEVSNLFFKTVPIVLFFRLAAIHYFGLNQGFWRYASIQDFLNLAGATIVSSAGIWAAVQFSPFTGYPHSVYVIDGAIFLLVLAAFRIIKRVHTLLTTPLAGARRVLIIGAGNAGEMVARDMMRNPSYNRQPVAFIDDDPKKRLMKIHNIPVIGHSHELEKGIGKVQPDEILIAIPSISRIQLKKLINRCKSFGLPIKSLPNLSAILGGNVSVTDIRSLDIEDLIGRPEITLHDPEVEEKIRGKRILVTGAGGSIGSELCRQIASFQPEKLILFELGENALHHIQIDLSERFPTIPLEVVLGDILHEEKLEQTFALNKPQIIFHAAAYKHVPMMEANPLEAVRNNILGTYRVMMAADRHGAEEFVLISTDKAVYPSSVMGATKRVAEMLVRYFNPKGRTKLVSVRFGNVLESNGSVVPLFREQIKRGGPVKVTHSEIRRYFITIQEAVQLVLHASLLGKGGEVFVLDMGEPIKILDLAKTMIILSGFSPEKDIPIQIVGLRPGEKLFEDLFEKDEEVVQTRHEKIRLAQNGIVTQDLLSYIEKFSAMDHQTDLPQIKAKLKELIPTYSGVETPSGRSTVSITEISMKAKDET
jgi:FlaA1/EpsC-like NDP-sugar epimerase/lipopolysaccharide/colanic/teichoic acid biosynthesis glycosyltransferase